jgi:hypothetical protein
MGLIKAQEVPVQPKTPEKSEIPAPPAPPKFDEQAWKDWGENFKKSFDEKKWKDWGEKVEKSFQGFDQQFEGMDLASADFDKKMEKLNAKLKDLKIPAIPAIPELPPMPPMPAINIPSGTFTNNGWTLGAPQDAVEKVKKLTKTYPIDANDQLLVTTSYGKITVNTWDKNEIKVDVEIKAYAASDDDAQKLLDGVSIDNSKQGNLVKFITNFGTTNRSNSWLSTSFWRGGDNKQKIDVYYTVYMPSKNTLNLKTNYTNIILPDFNGAVGINMNYGDLNAGKLDGLINKISSNYAKMEIEYINNAEVFCSYGDLDINKAKNLKVSCNYTHVNISSLSEDNSVKMNYGDFQLNSLDKNFKTLNLTSNYLQSKFNFAGSPNFNFDISTSNSSFKYDDSKVTITSKTPSDEQKGWSSTKNYKGYYGKSPSGNITIKSNYGGVKFN